jgi:hypothetical protein
VADQLVTPSELASFLQLTYADLTAAQQATMAMLVQLSTGKIQAACGQRLIEATNTFVIDVEWGSRSPWLDLPQRPIRSVASVEIDGTVYTDWLLRSQRLWRLGGWGLNASAPSQVTVADCAHGYPTGAQFLQLARDMCLALAAAGYGNPGGSVASEQIDDYRVTYAEADSRMQVTPGMRDMLRDQYGMTAYVTGGW